MTPPEPGTAPGPDTARDAGAAPRRRRPGAQADGAREPDELRAPDDHAVRPGARTVLRRSLREAERSLRERESAAAPEPRAPLSTPPRPSSRRRRTTPRRPRPPPRRPPPSTSRTSCAAGSACARSVPGSTPRRRCGAGSVRCSSPCSPASCAWSSLNHPSRLIFDETYYVKQAYSLLVLGYEGEWAENANPAFARGDYSGLSTRADYVVHPSVGKWMIAAGIKLFGADNGAGWRVAAAVVGTLSVLLLARMATRLFGSALLGTTAGLLLAIDGLHLTESRTSLLDIFVMFWVLVGLWCVLRDRRLEPGPAGQTPGRAAGGRPARGRPGPAPRGCGGGWSPPASPWAWPAG